MPIIAKYFGIPVLSFIKSAEIKRAQLKSCASMIWATISRRFR